MEQTIVCKRENWLKLRFRRIKSLFRKKEESNVIKHAKQELKAVGYDLDEKEEGPNKWIVEDVLELLSVFASQGHSGFSASYCIDVFTKLASFKPLSPITCGESEWVDIGGNLYQNNRLGSVFNEGKEGKPYYLDAIVFREDNGSCFTGTVGEVKSRQNIRLPFSPKTFYVDVISYEVSPDNWEFTIKDPTQLIPVFDYYDEYK
jgi:hypothetical protein